MDIITQIVSCLQSAKEDISRNVTLATNKISLPKEETPNLPVESSAPKTDSVVLIAGIVLFVIGLISKRTFSTICIIFGLGGVAYYFLKHFSGNKKTPTKHSVKNTIDYTNESQRIFNILKDTHSRAAEQWDKAVMEQSSLMNANIDNAALETEKRIQAYDVLATRSTVSFPMMDVLQKLMSCQSVSDFRQCLDAFNRDYNQVLNNAFMEESLKYQKIKHILLDK